MGLLDVLELKGRKPKDICVPEHAKKRLAEQAKAEARELVAIASEKRAEEKKKKPEFFDDIARFEVESFYRTPKAFFVMGTCLSGKISKKSVLRRGSRNLKLKDVKAGFFKGKKHLTRWDKGTIQFEEPMPLYSGDILKFW
ncbi:MAG: hypothetical protein HY394_03610 [Candidatus Diapherotrites archaeon]|nr:hypothetical protein [Candidatus Diapherotrites archaeon]